MRTLYSIMYLLTGSRKWLSRRLRTYRVKGPACKVCGAPARFTMGGAGHDRPVHYCEDHVPEGV